MSLMRFAQFISLAYTSRQAPSAQKASSKLINCAKRFKLIKLFFLAQAQENPYLSHELTESRPKAMSGN